MRETQTVQPHMGNKKTKKKLKEEKQEIENVSSPDPAQPLTCHDPSFGQRICMQQLQHCGTQVVLLRSPSCLQPVGEINFTKLVLLYSSNRT